MFKDACSLGESFGKVKRDATNGYILKVVGIRKKQTIPLPIFPCHSHFFISLFFLYLLIQIVPIVRLIYQTLYGSLLLGFFGSSHG